MPKDLIALKITQNGVFLLLETPSVRRIAYCIHLCMRRTAYHTHLSMRHIAYRTHLSMHRIAYRTPIPVAMCDWLGDALYFAKP